MSREQGNGKQEDEPGGRAEERPEEKPEEEGQAAIPIGED